MSSHFLERLALFALFLFVSFSIKAQESIGTERPTISTSSHTIERNAFQFEQGFVVTGNNLVLDGLFRLAVSERGEIRLFTTYKDNSTYWGAKVNICKQDNYKPGVSIQSFFGDQFNLIDFRASLSQKITEKISGTLNIGKGQNYYVALAVNYPIGNKGSLFAEGYYDDLLQQFNTGFTYLINSETQVDISAGLLSGGTNFIGIGVARRFLYKKPPE